MKAVVIYWSKTGNTERVARAIHEVLESAGVQVLCRRAEDAKDVDWYDCDLVCLGFPSYRWHPSLSRLLASLVTVQALILLLWTNITNTRLLNCMIPCGRVWVHGLSRYRLSSRLPAPI